MADLTSMLQAAAGAAVQPSGYQISRSLRFNSADSAYLSRTPASAGDRKTWTWSGWVKRSGLGTLQELFNGNWASNDNGFLTINFSSADKFEVQIYNSVLRITTQVFRDVSAWYHFVVAVDTTQATAANRVKVYLNGLEITSFSTNNAPTLDLLTAVNYNGAHYIGTFSGSGNLFNGYMTEINLIDGQALTPSSFGETNATTGVWSPIRYAGSYGTNGFYLNFSDNSDVTATTLGKDQAGSNNWTPSGSPGFSVTAGAGNDSLVDTPTPYGTDTGAGGEVRGNYATLNPLKSVATLSNGNLDATIATVNWFTATSTFGVSSGKWYWETVFTGLSGLNFGMVGIVSPTFNVASPNFIGNDAGSYGYFSPTGQKYNNNSGAAYGASYADGDVVGVALDMDAGTITFYKNNSSQGTAYSGITGIVIPSVGVYGTTAVVNFGQRPFAYTAPSGFKALVTTNLPEPTVVQGDDYFNTVLYTGNTPSTNAITGVGFAPDWVWVKSITAAEPSNLVDRVRGDNLRLKSSTTDAESAATFALNSDGFTVGANSESNTGSMVAWNWKANGAGVSNTAGTVAGTVTVSANTTAGFSIVTWTNPASGTPTIGHGLSVAPSFIIVKDRTFAYNWDVGSDSIGWANRLNLNTTGATSSGFWNSTAPTSSVFTYAASGGNSGDSMVAYCFAEVEGFSKFGSYTGNGSADGPFVYTGFRPAFVLVKGTSAGYIWTIEDNKRDTFNPETKYLQPQASDAEGTFTTQDFTSNGFKIRTADTAWNGSGITYIYMAFAESPFKFALGR